MSDSIKNKEVLKQITSLLDNVGEEDNFLKKLVLDVLNLSFIENNSGAKQHIDKKIDDWIDAEVRVVLKNED